MDAVEYLNVGSVREYDKFSGKPQELGTLPRCSVFKSERVSQVGLTQRTSLGPRVRLLGRQGHWAVG